MPSLVELNLAVALPLLVLAGTSLVALLFDLVLPRRISAPASLAAGYAGLAVAAAALPGLWMEPGTAFWGGFASDRLTTAITGAVLLSAGAGLALYAGRPEDDRVPAYVALVLWSAAGMVVLAGARDLMVLFLGLELLSLGLYVLCGFRTEDAASGEAALKYLMLGSLASAFLLMGSALLYGLAGDVRLTAIGQAVAANPGLLGYAGSGLLITGLAFKLALVPFHVWAPDVYQGAPTSITAYMSVGTKAAAFAALGRFLGEVGAWGGSHDLLDPVWFLGALSMIAGNLAAIPQNNLKRILAFSGVAQAGYLFAGMPGLSPDGLSAAVFYLGAYALMNLGAFAVVATLDRSAPGGADLESYRGLFYRRPWLASAMTLFLLSLAGIPPTGGFTGKLYLLSSAVRHGGLPLAVILVVGTIISLYVYLRVVLVMFTPEARGTGQEATGGEGAPRAPAVTVPLWIIAFVAAAGTIELGILPGPALQLAAQLLQVP